jgi:hypothetical protein
MSFECLASQACRKKTFCVSARAQMEEPHFNGPLARWLRRALTPTPDPWSAEVTTQVNSDSAVPLCPDCLLVQGPNRWFCPRCGFPTGDYVAVMPYLQVFVVGELFRRGVSGLPERRKGVQCFLVIYSLCEYTIFAPVYWFWMYRRSRGGPICVRLRSADDDHNHA